LCEDVDLRLVNKRVLESLIKSSALDSLGARRTQLYAMIDRALDFDVFADVVGGTGRIDLLRIPNAELRARQGQRKVPTAVPD